MVALVVVDSAGAALALPPLADAGTLDDAETETEADALESAVTSPKL